MALARWRTPIGRFGLGRERCHIPSARPSILPARIIGIGEDFARHEPPRRLSDRSAAPAASADRASTRCRPAPRPRGCAPQPPSIGSSLGGDLSCRARRRRRSCRRPASASASASRRARRSRTARCFGELGEGVGGLVGLAGGAQLPGGGIGGRGLGALRAPRNSATAGSPPRRATSTADGGDDVVAIFLPQLLVALAADFLLDFAEDVGHGKFLSGAGRGHCCQAGPARP